MDWRRIIGGGTDDFGRGGMAAPGSPEAARRQRLARIGATAPPRPDVGPRQPSYGYRGLQESASDNGQSPFPWRMPQPEAAAARQVRESQKRGRGRPIDVFGRAMVDQANTPTMRIVGIPMGRDPSHPEIDPGRPLASGYGLQGHAPTSAKVWNPSAPQRLGLLTYGQDFRRAFSEVMADVEHVTGAPQGMLSMINRRESYPNRYGYDTDGATGSSAVGPFQFTQGTFREWLNGTGEIYHIPPSMQPEERDMQRYDSRVAGAMTAESMRYYARAYHMSDPEGPEASIADLYMTHFGGEESIPLVVAVRHGQGGRPASQFYRNPDVVNNHLTDFYVNGDRSQPRSAAEFYTWMTGNTPDSPHRKDYFNTGHRVGLPTTPAKFGPRLDGSQEPASVIAPGVLAPPSDWRPPGNNLSPQNTTSADGRQPVDRGGATPPTGPP